MRQAPIVVVLKAAGSAEPLWVSHWAAPEPHRQGGHRDDDNRPYEEPGLAPARGFPSVRKLADQNVVQDK